MKSGMLFMLASCLVVVPSTLSCKKKKQTKVETQQVSFPPKKGGMAQDISEQKDILHMKRQHQHKQLQKASTPKKRELDLQPPIKEEEKKKYGKMQEWTPVEFKQKNRLPVKYRDNLEAALDVEAVNNTLRLVFNLLADTGFVSYYPERFKIPKAAYEELQRLNLLEVPRDPYNKFNESLLDRIKVLEGKVQEEIEITQRLDKIAGKYRLAKLSFRWKTKNGQSKVGTALLVLVNYNWRLLRLDIRM